MLEALLQQQRQHQARVVAAAEVHPPLRAGQARLHPQQGAHVLAGTLDEVEPVGGRHRRARPPRAAVPRDGLERPAGRQLEERALGHPPDALEAGATLLEGAAEHQPGHGPPIALGLLAGWRDQPGRHRGPVRRHHDLVALAPVQRHEAQGVGGHRAGPVDRDRHRREPPVEVREGIAQGHPLEEVGELRGPGEVVLSHAVARYQAMPPNAVKPEGRTSHRRPMPRRSASCQTATRTRPSGVAQLTWADGV